MSSSDFNAADAQGRFWYAFNLLICAMAALGAIILVLATLLVLTEITSRYFFRRPIMGAVEITEYCLVWITFLAAPWVQARGGNVKVEFIVTSLKPKTQSILCFLMCLLATATCLLLAYVGVATVRSHYELGYDLSTPLHPPSAPIISIIPISALLLTIQFARETVFHWRKVAGD